MRTAVGQTDIGSVRPMNEDAYDIGKFEDGTVWAVICDGMGGAKAGNVASSIAVEQIVKTICKGYREDFNSNSIRSLLQSAVAAANSSIYNMAQEDLQYRGMGTTVIACIVKEETVHLVHVGDSRAYLLTGDEMQQVTRDHSMVQLLIERGDLTEQQAAKHPDKNKITRAVGVEAEVDSDYCESYLEQEQCLLLCTDGLTNTLSEEKIVEISAQAGFLNSPTALIEAAKAAVCADNITVVVIA